MTWSSSIRNDKAVHAGVTYRAHNNALVVSAFGSQKHYPAASRMAARAHAEVLAVGAL